MNLHKLTSNQYYGGLNRRFDKRARLLRKLGYAYEHTEFNVAMFIRRKFGKVYAIPAATLSHADNRAFYDSIQRTCR